jgi:CrcB protein
VRHGYDELLAVFAGGFLGAVARAELDAGIDLAPGHWPWATFIVNISGAFLLGYFAARVRLRLPLVAHHRAFLEVGFCGALTTFSTMQLELLDMLDTNRVGLAAAYAAASIVFGYLAVGAATRLVRRT